MKQIFLLTFLFCSLPGLEAEQIGIYQHGTVVRMHMGDCLLAKPGFMVAFGGAPATMGQESCPEYTLVSDNVVFVVVGKSSSQLIPLSETIDFRLQKKEVAVRLDDAKHETKLRVKEMMVRSDWDRLQRHMDEQMKASADHEEGIKTRD